MLNLSQMSRVSHLLQFLGAIEPNREVVIILVFTLNGPNVNIGRGTLSSTASESTDRAGPQGKQSWFLFQEHNQDCPRQENEWKGPSVVHLRQTCLSS